MGMHVSAGVAYVGVGVGVGWSAGVAYVGVVWVWVSVVSGCQ